MGTPFAAAVSVMSSFESKLSPLQSKITHNESEEDIEFKVVVEATILTNPMENPPGLTINYRNPPKLAQDIADVLDLPATFKDPLANLRLTEKYVNLVNFTTDKNSEKSRFPQRSSFYSVYNPRGQINKISKKKYLHTTPKKYIPIPPLVRNSYFYSYGRCPECAGIMYDFQKNELKQQQNTIHHNFKANDLDAKKSIDKKFVRPNSASSKFNQLEHLDGKAKQAYSYGKQMDCFNIINAHLRDIKGVSQEDKELENKTDLTGANLNIHVSLAPSVLDVYRPNVPCTDFDADTSDQASITTFGSAAQECQHGKFLSKYSSEFNSACKKMSSEKFTPRNQLKPYVADLRGMFPGGVILSAKIKDYDFHIPLISLKTDEMRELYNVTILKDFSLRRLFDKKNFKNLPAELQYLRTIKKEYNPEDGIMKVPDGESDRDQGFRITMQNTCLCIINEIANQFYEADFCILSLFVNWFERARPDVSLRQITTPREFSKLFQMLGENIYCNIHNPAGCTRLEMLIVMVTATKEPKLRHFMWAHIKHWLEPLICSLFASRVGTREETCYTLAYLFSSNILSEDIRHNVSFDIAYDTVAAVIKAIEQKPDTFMHFYCLLGYILEGCPNYSILECIVDRGPHCKHIIFRQRWPLFIYYAFRHWNLAYLTVDSAFPKKMAEAMEAAMLIPITKKAARFALYAITQKIRKPVALVTGWTLDWLPRE